MNAAGTPATNPRSTSLKNLGGLGDGVTLVKGAEWARSQDFSILTERLEVRTFPFSQKYLNEYNLLIACITTYDNTFEKLQSANYTETMSLICSV